MLERVSAAVVIVLMTAVAVGAQTPTKAPARTLTKTYVPPKRRGATRTSRATSPTSTSRARRSSARGIRGPAARRRRRAQELVEDSERPAADRARARAVPRRRSRRHASADSAEFRDIYEVSKGSRPWFVVDPPDGKIPPMTPEAQQRIAARRAAGSSFSNGPFNGPEDFSLYDRCITRGFPGSMLPAIYGNSYQIVQGPGWVAIRYEMIHETRVIPLDGRPHVGKTHSAWTWATRAATGTATRSSSRRRISASAARIATRTPATLRLVERFTRDRARPMEWSVTVDDPTTWTQAVDVRHAPDHKRPASRSYEYACHEGNYAMTNILNGSRAAEAAAKAAK